MDHPWEIARQRLNMLEASTNERDEYIKECISNNEPIDPNAVSDYNHNIKVDLVYLLKLLKEAIQQKGIKK